MKLRSCGARLKTLSSLPTLIRVVDVVKLVSAGLYVCIVIYDCVWLVNGCVRVLIKNDEQRHELTDVF